MQILILNYNSDIFTNLYSYFASPYINDFSHLVYEGQNYYALVPLEFSILENLYISNDLDLSRYFRYKSPTYIDYSSFWVYVANR